MAGTIYTDFNQLAQLRVDAQQDQSAALEETAVQFEALFIQMMLKSMRDSVEEGGLIGSDQMDAYQQMADKQLSLQMSEHGGIGIARAMVEQMSRSGIVENQVGLPNDANRSAAGPQAVSYPLVDPRAKAFDLSAANSTTRKWEG